MKKLLALASLVVFCASGLVVAGCGSGGAGHSSQRTSSPSGTWRKLPAPPFAIPQGLTSVWTGRQLILFGRKPLVNPSVDVAEAYDPGSNSWTRLSPPPGPGYVPGYTAVWTGKEMLAFGAFHSVAYTPQTNAWRELRKPVPTGFVAWTGREAIGWGGGCCGDATADGAAYNPDTDSYRSLPLSPLAPSQGALGAWTGRELILFVSGYTPDGKPYPASFARAAAYNPATDTWRRLAPLPESGLRFGGTAVWDGREVLVVGAGARSRSALAYKPSTNRWRRLSPLPAGRLDTAAFWTGKRLLVWGSGTGSSAIPPAGLSYEPKADRWSVLARAPLRGSGQTAVWTGHELIVWGGVIGTPVGTAHPEDYPKYLADGAAFTPALEGSSR